MSSLICDMWQLFLKLFTDLLHVIAQAIEAVVDTALDLLDHVADAILPSSSSILKLAALGLGAFFLFRMLGGPTKDKKDEEKKGNSAAIASERAAYMRGVVDVSTASRYRRQQ